MLQHGGGGALARWYKLASGRIAALRLHYLNILESSKIEVTVAGSIAFLIMTASLQRSTLKYLIYFAYPVPLLGVGWKYTRIYIPEKDA
ncbi:hypothetical protein TNCV_1150571 [Trichonephila clavipes]|nr:hypothetical protein TNCV_1150571 [Trichonephila clavipes]